MALCRTERALHEFALITRPSRVGGVLQECRDLSHVARPFTHHRSSTARAPAHGACRCAGELIHEVRGKQRHVVAPLRERRQVDAATLRR